MGEVIFSLFLDQDCLEDLEESSCIMSNCVFFGKDFWSQKFVFLVVLEDVEGFFVGCFGCILCFFCG